LKNKNRLKDAIRCILCACCTASCPVNQGKTTEPYIGPGEKERIALLDNKDGAWGCQTKWMCTKASPKEIPVTKEIF
jgi:succinate dehydrogenase / fumarate reductase iron-sulfur subunit